MKKRKIRILEHRIAVVELNHYGRRTCSKLCLRAAAVRRPTYKCGQNARPSTTVDNTIDSLWRNCPSPEFGTKFQREIPLF